MTQGMTVITSRNHFWMLLRVVVITQGIIVIILTTIAAPIRKIYLKVYPKIVRMRNTGLVIVTLKLMSVIVPTRHLPGLFVIIIWLGRMTRMTPCQYSVTMIVNLEATQTASFSILEVKEKA